MDQASSRETCKVHACLSAYAQQERVVAVAQTHTHTHCPICLGSIYHKIKGSACLLNLFLHVIVGL